MSLCESTAHPEILDQCLFSPFDSIGPADVSVSENLFEHLRINCKYYTLACQSPSTHNHGQDSSNQYSIIHINARSLLSDDKFSEFQVFLHLTKCKWSIICVSETWLKDGLEERRCLDGYSCFFDNRTLGVGGGVAVYAKNDCLKKLHKMPKPVKCTESILLECQLSTTQSILIFMIYKPPSLSHSLFIDEFSHALDCLSTKNKTVFVCGDFNYDLLHLNQNNQALEFFSALASTGFLPLVSKPTRTQETCVSLIDNIFCNNLSIVQTSGIIFDDTSDHYPVFATLTLNMVFANRTKESKVIFDYSKIDEFTHDLEQSMGGFENITDPETACNVLIQAYCTLRGKYSFQYKPTRKNSSIKPWITPAILASIINRSKLFALKQKQPSPENKKKYIKYRNMLNGIIRYAKQKYIESELESNKNNAKRMWNILNEYAIGKCTTNQMPNSFRNTNDKVLDDPYDIAENFNLFFSSVGKTLQNTIQPCSGSPLACVNKCNNTVKEVELTNSSEIIRIISNMTNVGGGVDNINGKLFKLTYKSIIHHIVHFVNCCLRTGIFPKKLKIAVIKPVFKSGEKTDMNNYRPISILPYISKVVEKVMHHRMMDHITQNNILCCNQFGFRKGHSTYMPLLFLQDKITRGFEDNNVTCGIYLDLKKAFDTVEHNILLSKLSVYGFAGTFFNLIESYLSDRFQCVEFHTIKSKLQQVSIGVPQGSILGPLLFILYINDLPNVCKQASTLLYADDTAIFFQSKNTTQLQSTLDTELPLLCSWFRTNKLSLNTNKTYFQLYNASGQNGKIKVSLNGTIIKHSETVKYLGVFIDTNIKWKSHIDHVAAIVSRNIGIMNRSKFFFESQTSVAAI